MASWRNCQSVSQGLIKKKTCRTDNNWVLPVRMTENISGNFSYSYVSGLAKCPLYWQLNMLVIRTGCQYRSFQCDRITRTNTYVSVNYFRHIPIIVFYSLTTCWMAVGRGPIRGPGGRFNINTPSHQYRKIHCGDNTILWPSYLPNGISYTNKQRVLMHGHQGWNVRHGLCHIYMIYVYIWVVYSLCLFCCLFIIVTTQFVALYKPCKPKPKPSTYDPRTTTPWQRSKDRT